MGQSKRRRALVWPGLGWAVAIGLAVALAVSVALGLATEHRLRAELTQLQARSVSSGRDLALCEANAVSLKQNLAISQALVSRLTTGNPLSAAEILARKPAGFDACTRAFEAEALVREATR